MTYRDHQFPQELWDDFAQSGLLGCLVPEDYGGNDTRACSPSPLAFEDTDGPGLLPRPDARHLAWTPPASSRTAPRT